MGCHFLTAAATTLSGVGLSGFLTLCSQNEVLCFVVYSTVLQQL
mgnify:FL=1